MSEIRNIPSQQMDEKCPICNSGWMRPTGIVVPNNPPQFEHRCTNCNYKQNYSVRYPYVI